MEMKVEAVITDSGTVKIETLGADGKLMIIEKTLATNEWKRLKALFPGDKNET